MVEGFIAEHKVTIEEALVEWPSSKFEAFYTSFTRRKVAEELKERRSLELAAVWGNPNYDPTKDDGEIREKLSRSIDERFTNAIGMVYGDSPVKEEEVDYDDPFFAPIKKAQDKTLPTEKIEA